MGVTVITALGTLADGFQAGYSSMMQGTKADMVLSQIPWMSVTALSTRKSEQNLPSCRKSNLLPVCFRDWYRRKASHSLSFLVNLNKGLTILKGVNLCFYQKLVQCGCTRLISTHNKLEYTDFSRLHRLRLEDSFLPGALRNPCIVTFRGAS